MTTSHSLRFSFALLATLLLAGSTLAQNGRVTLKSAAMVSGSIARLGDIAAIDVADKAQRAELRDLPLTPAPSSGQSSYLTINDIRSILAARGFSTTNITVVGPSRVRLTSGSTAESTEQPLTKATSLPRRTRGGQYVSAPRPQEVMTVAHVVRNVRRGEIIRPEDVEMRQLSVVRRDANYPTDLRQIVGKQAARGISADRPISDNDVREPVIVRRNEVVTVFAYAGNIVVRRQMLALSDAGKGELVEVQPIEPKTFGRAREGERFQAQVIGPGEAVVLTGHTQVQTSRPIHPTAQLGASR